MRFKIPVNHPLHDKTAPVHCFWELTHRLDLEHLRMAFTHSAERPVKRPNSSYKPGMPAEEKFSVHSEPNARVMLARRWAKNVFFTFAGIMDVPQTVCIHPFKTTESNTVGGYFPSHKSFYQAWQSFDVRRQAAKFKAGDMKAASQRPDVSYDQWLIKARETWAKAVLISRPSEFPTKELESFYMSRLKSEVGIGELSVEQWQKRQAKFLEWIDTNYRNNCDRALEASKRRVDAATNS